MNKQKSKALKNTANKSGFLRALFLGLIVCIASWLLLSLVFSFVVSKQTDSSAYIKVFAPITAAVSLILGGIAVGFAEKTLSVLTSFVLGCAALGICYALSVWLDLSYELGSLAKTALIAVMLVCPVIGAKVSCRKKGIKQRRKR